MPALLWNRIGGRYPSNFSFHPERAGAGLFNGITGSRKRGFHFGKLGGPFKGSWELWTAPPAPSKGNRTGHRCWPQQLPVPGVGVLGCNPSCIPTPLDPGMQPFLGEGVGSIRGSLQPAFPSHAGVGGRHLGSPPLSLRVSSTFSIRPPESPGQPAVHGGATREEDRMVGQRLCLSCS